MENRSYWLVYKTGHILKHSRKTPRYNEFYKVFQMFNQTSLSKMNYWRILQEKGSKYLLHIIFTHKVGKNTYTETRKVDWYLKISKSCPFY